MSVLTSPIDRLRELGGELWLDGDSLRYRIPAGNPETPELLADLRRDRKTLVALLKDQESKAPSLEEVTSMLPPGFRVASYRPKKAPFAVAPVSIVTNAGKFFRAYLRDLRWLAEHPNTHATAPAADILAKLADAGLE